MVLVLVVGIVSREVPFVLPFNLSNYDGYQAGVVVRVLEVDFVEV